MERMLSDRVRALQTRILDDESLDVETLDGVLEFLEESNEAALEEGLQQCRSMLDRLDV
jgi:hypothetical protein